MDRARRTLIVSFASLVFAGAGAGGAAVAAGFLTADDPPSRPGWGPGTAGLPGGGLSASQAGRAEKVATADAFVARVLNGAAHTVEQVLPWYMSDGKTIRGAVVTVRTDSPLSTDELAWPSVRFQPGQPDAPVASTTRMSVTQLRTVLVFVDLRRGVSVAVEPGTEAVRTLSPGNPSYAPTGE